MLHYNENISFTVLSYWNTEGHGDHVTVHLESLISAAPTIIVNLMNNVMMMNDFEQKESPANLRSHLEKVQ